MWALDSLKSLAISSFLLSAVCLQWKTRSCQLFALAAMPAPDALLCPPP